jgi:hypothetical protein
MTTSHVERTQLVELIAERDALRARLAGDLPTATRWLQRKVWRQAEALDTLNRRVVSQRFVLRTFDGLGRSLTTSKYRDAQARVSDDAQRERIDAQPAGSGWVGGGAAAHPDIAGAGAVSQRRHPRRELKTRSRW